LLHLSTNKRFHLYASYRGLSHPQTFFLHVTDVAKSTPNLAKIGS